MIRPEDAHLYRYYEARVVVTAEMVLGSSFDVVPLAEEDLRRRLTHEVGAVLAGAAEIVWQVECWVQHGGGERELLPWTPWQRGDLAPPRAWVFHCRARTPNTLVLLGQGG